MTYYIFYESPVGVLLLTRNSRALTGVHFVGQGKAPAVKIDWQEDAPQFAKTVAELDAYFAGRLSNFSLQLEFEGTPFQQRVWRELCRIPYGAQSSYKELAASIGTPSAARAVGTALGKNPICIVGPCHRVIASDGTLGGYGGGLATKQFLLELERAHHQPV